MPWRTRRRRARGARRRRVRRVPARARVDRRALGARRPPRVRRGQGRDVRAGRAGLLGAAAEARPCTRDATPSAAAARRRSTFVHRSIVAGADYQIVVRVADLPTAATLPIGLARRAASTRSSAGPRAPTNVHAVGVRRRAAYDVRRARGRRVAVPRSRSSCTARRLYVIRVEAQVGAAPVLDAVAKSFRFTQLARAAASLPDPLGGPAVGPLGGHELVVGRRRVRRRAAARRGPRPRSRCARSSRIHSPGGSTQSTVPSSKSMQAEVVVGAVQPPRLLRPSPGST